MGLLDTRGKRSSWCCIGTALGVGAMVLYLFLFTPDFASLGQPDDPQGGYLLVGGVIFFTVMISFYIIIAIIDWKFVD